MPNLRTKLPLYWYQSSLHPLLYILLPFSWLFRLIVWARKQAYRRGLLKSVSFPVPVIVVGNITVGGAGKTPLTIYLAKLFAKQGYRVGIVSRGVGGRQAKAAHRVLLTDQASVVGDEAILLLQETGCPVVVCRDRVAAVALLLQTTDCNLVLSDDGLQHYRLQPQVTIAVVDRARGLGNGQLLPAGPLREPNVRLQEVDMVVVNGVEMAVTPDQVVSLKKPMERYPFHSFAKKQVHAVAAIGNPQSFFQSLQQAGFNIIPHVFPDHYLYNKADFRFDDRLPILMTCKDAVKCKDFCDERFWMVTTRVEMSEAFDRAMLNRVQ